MSDPRTLFRFDTRAVVVVRDDLKPWQELNVTAFLSTGIADASLLGDAYRDADGTEYAPMLREPIMVRVASLAELRAIRATAVARGLRTVIYTAELFTTTHDAANRAAVAGVAGEALDLVGIGIHGPKNAIDRITKRTNLHA